MPRPAFERFSGPVNITVTLIRVECQNQSGIKLETAHIVENTAGNHLMPTQ